MGHSQSESITLDEVCFPVGREGNPSDTPATLKRGGESTTPIALFNQNRIV